MPDMNMSVFEEAKRNQLVTEVDIQTQAALDDYQVKLANIANPTQSQDNVVIDRYGRFVSHWNESLDFDTWIKLNAEIAGKKLLMLHGNSNVNSVSDGDNIFIQWHGAASAQYLDALNIIPSNIVYESRCKVTSATHNVFFGLSNLQNFLTDDSMPISSYSSGNDRYIGARNEGVLTSKSEAPSFTVDTYYKLKIINTGSAITGFVDDNQIDTGDITTNLPDENLGLGMYFNAGTGAQNWAFVRKYVTTEPTYNISTSKNISTALKSLGRVG